MEKTEILRRARDYVAKERDAGFRAEVEGLLAKADGDEEGYGRAGRQVLPRP